MAPPHNNDQQLPRVLAGPILRRLLPDRLVIWMATTVPADVQITLKTAEKTDQSMTLALGSAGLGHLKAAARLHYLMIDLVLPESLPQDQWVSYDLALRFADDAEGEWQGHNKWAEGLCYPGHELPGFILPSKVDSLLHGSCRKPHHDSEDGLVAADTLIGRILSIGRNENDELPKWPSAIVLSGDQIYADDVAGPMLRATHQLIDRLDAPNEDFSGLEITEFGDSKDLQRHADSYYRRENFLPKIRPNRDLFEVLFGGVRKPIFTADAAHNHLVSLAEALVMYLLVWSPSAWQGLKLDPPVELSSEEKDLYAKERAIIDRFVAGLSAVRRVMAHLPVAMIFDDHDITDDWNLNRDWEETAYGHPFSKRVIGNALLAYLINQAWGNRPEAFGGALFDRIAEALRAPGGEDHDQLIDELLDLERWDYQWPTEPPLIVLDTRTRRWRADRRAHKPSGLLDWEAVTDLQNLLRQKDAVLLVSAAPIFGVKLIENCQKFFTWIGKPLLVDAEYWLAHPRTADAILNVFRHPKTPSRFVVLSGDVHYSFVYDIELRGRARGPDIWQICSSGLKNTFPEKLLSKLDFLNRWLYSPRSPLNWFTRRRELKVIPRKPKGALPGRRLCNGSGIGVVEFEPDGSPWRIRQLLSSGPFVTFARREKEARWD